MMLILGFLVLNLPVEQALMEEQAVIEILSFLDLNLPVEQAMVELPVLAGNELEEAADDVMDDEYDIFEGNKILEADQYLILDEYEEADGVELVLKEDVFQLVFAEHGYDIPAFAFKCANIIAAVDMIIEDFMELIPFDVWTVEETRMLYLLYMRHDGEWLHIFHDPDFVRLGGHRFHNPIGDKILRDDQVAYKAGIPAPWLTIDRLCPIKRVVFIGPIEDPWLCVGGDRVLVFGNFHEDDQSLALADWVHAFDAAYDALTFEDDN